MAIYESLPESSTCGHTTLCQVPESLHTKIRVNKGESASGLPEQTDWERDTSYSHETALDCKNSPRLLLPTESRQASDRAAAQLPPACLLPTFKQLSEMASAAARDKPFAALRVTRGDCSTC